MKKTCFFLLLLFICSPVFADEDYNIDSEFSIDADFSFNGAVASLAEGKSVISADELWGRVFEYAVKEVKANLSVALSIFGVVVIFAILSSMENGFGKKGVTETAFFVVYMLVIGLLAASFSEIASIGTSLVNDIVLFSNTAIPLMGTAIISSGNIGVYSIMSPSMLMAANIMGNIIKLAGLPALYASLGLCIIGNLSEKYPLQEIGALLRRTALWITTGAATILCAIVGIAGMSSGAVNGVAVKTLKFALGSSVPVLGSVLSSSVEAVAGGAIILKNALGAAGIIFLVLMVLFPIIKIAVVILIYKAVSALMKPFADERIVNVVGEMSDVLGCMIGFIAAVSIAALLSFTMLINASNMGVMLR